MRDLEVIIDAGVTMRKNIIANVRMFREVHGCLALTAAQRSSDPDSFVGGQ
jgi:hypothetical protein